MVTDGSGRRPNKRRELGAQSRATILDSALRIMAESGYERTSIAQLAKESGLPASSIYWHFGSKAGVLAAVLERGAESFFALASDDHLPEVSGQDVLVNLRVRFHQGRRAAEANPEFLKLLFLLTLANPGDEKVVGLVARVNAQGKGVLHHQIASAFRGAGATQAAGIADRLTLPALAYFNGIFLTKQTNPDAAVDALIDSMAEAVYLLAIER